METGLGGLQVCVVDVFCYKTTFISVIASALKIILNFSLILLHDLLIWLNLQKHAALLSRCFLLVPKQNLVAINSYPSFILPADSACLWFSSLEYASHSYHALLDIYKITKILYNILDQLNNARLFFFYYIHSSFSWWSLKQFPVSVRVNYSWKLPVKTL